MLQHANTIGKLFSQRIFKTPHNLAIGWIEHHEVKSMTFAQYKNQVEIISLGLQQLKSIAKEKVAILSETSKEWHLLDMAVLLCRGCIVPIYPTYIAKEINYILNHSEASILVIENEKQAEKIVSILKNLSFLKIVISFQELSNEIASKIKSRCTFVSLKDIYKLGLEEVKSNPDFLANQIASIEPNDLASIIYTSGTTGEPKGVVISQKGFSIMLNNVEKAIKGAFTTQDRTLIFLPLSHVLGRCESLLPLIFGWQCIYVESMDRLLQNIQLVKPTVMISVPRIFEKIHNSIQEKINSGSFIEKQSYKLACMVAESYFKKIDNDLSPNSFEILQYQLAYKTFFSKIYQKFGGKIRYFVSGGAPLSEDIIKILRYSGLTIIEGYGLTETIAPCCLNPLSKQIPGTVGKPIGDVQIKFAKDGEILIKTEAMLIEYYKNPEATQESIVDGWLHTGDIGEFTQDGYLKITDRKKDLIITSSGKNIAPQKIENMAKIQPHIGYLVVIGDKKNYLTALVGIEKESFFRHFNDLDLPSDCSIEDLARHPKVKAMIQREIDQINSELSHFETIKKFEIIPEELTPNNFLTPSLKVKRKLITKFYKDKIEAMYQ